MYKRVPYSLYLKTPYWRNLRKRIIRRAGCKCQLCGNAKNLQVHHKRYETRNGNSILFRETGKDLMVVCGNCHQRIHSITT